MKEPLLQTDQPGMQPAAGAGGQTKPTVALSLKLLFLFGTGILIVLAAYGIKARSATTKGLQQQADQAYAERAVSVIKPENAPATASLELQGQTQPYAQAAVYAQSTGYVRKWHFDIGSPVKEGDVLAELDTPEVDQQWDQAKATLKQAQAALDLSRATYERERDVLQRKAIAPQDYDTAEGNFLVNQATVNADEAALLRLEALKDFKLLKAPFEGIVTARNTDIGRMVNAGSGNPLFVVTRIKPLRVYLNVPESLAPEVAVGVSAELTFNEFPGRTFPGKVIRTAGAIDPTSRTLLTEVEVPNENGQLFAGAYTQVRLGTGRNRPYLLIPSNTLLFRSEGTMVGVVGSDKKVELKKIKIGKDLGTRLEITQGLSPEDQVIVNPSESLASGPMVRARPSQDEEERASATPEAKPF